MRNGHVWIGAACLLAATGCSKDTDQAPITPSNDTDQAPITLRLQYDDAGRIANIVDEAGEQTEIAYELLDPAGPVRRSVRRTDDGEVSIEFDRHGRRASMSSAADTIRYEYDGFNRLTSVQHDESPPVSYEYDVTGRLASLKVGANFVVKYGFDFLSRLESITTLAGTINYEYQTKDDGTIQIQRKLPNGVVTIRRYGLDGRLDSISHRSAEGQVLAEFRYAYRPDGLIEKIEESSQEEESLQEGKRSITYEYDVVQRLERVVDSKNGTTTYTYDKLGNRTALGRSDGTETTSSYDWAGRVLEHNGDPCEYDPSGNMSQYSDVAGEAHLRYTAEGALATVKRDGEEIRYRHDGDGDLIARIVNGRKSTFVPDPGSDVWRPLLAIDADARRTYYVWNGNTPLAALGHGKEYFFLADHLGSVRCVVDKNGNLLERMDYSPFGMPQDDLQTGGLTPGFCGLFYDAAARLYLTRARAYAPELARFLQPDPQHRIPFGSQKDLSMYSYCGADPVNFTDVTGAEPESGDSGRASPDWVPEIGACAAVGFKIGGPWGALGGAALCGSIIGAYEHWERDEKWEAAGKLATIPLEAGAWKAVKWGARSLPPIVRAKRFKYSTPYNPYANDADEYFELGWDVVPESVSRAKDAWDVGSSVPRYWDPGSYYGAAPGDSRDVETGGAAGQLAPLCLPRSTDSGLGTVRDSSELIFVDPETGETPSPTYSIGFDDDAEEAMSPTNVGGIDLSGAGEALEHLGALEGVALDDNGRLILISRKEGEIGLPPLRLDDVVTVFRCVYEHGVSPSVSIDPDPKNPDGPFHTVRHGPCTADTYVGWVLFEADRIMKTYSHGCDNVTTRQVISRIPDYKNSLELRFQYESSEPGTQYWDRNWILPAKLRRSQSSTRRLTIFDVALRVNSEIEILRDGKFVDAPESMRPRSAEAFVEWFTENYDAIAKEAWSTPPKESGISEPVSVFSELRRITLISAMAESLRNDGVPLPPWMCDFEVQPIPVPEKTPALKTELAKDRGTVTRTFSVHGGVTLTPSDSLVDTVSGAPEADRLASALQSVATHPSVTPVAFEHDGNEYQAVALPGGDTKQPLACRLRETDLLVPVAAGRSIRLVRHYHSFFAPTDVFGKAWTLDLPRLEEWRKRTKKVGDVISTKDVERLTSPLNTYSGVFDKVELVPEAEIKLAVPQEPSAVFLGSAGVRTDDRIGKPTCPLLLHDGQTWHFPESYGPLVAVEQAPFLTVYRRDSAGRIVRIEGWYGEEHLRAHIELEYGDNGQIAAARSSDGQVVEYVYNESGYLTQITRGADSVSYRYASGLVNEILRDGKLLRGFDYAERGQLARERRADGTAISYQANPTASGSQVSASLNGGPGLVTAAQTAEYDSRQRPVRRQLSDGTTIEWNYGDAKGKLVKVARQNREQFTIQTSPDGKQDTLRLPSGGQYRMERDHAGRVGALFEGDSQVLEQEWYSDGTVKSATLGHTAFNPKYREDDRLEEILVTPPGEGPFERWLKVHLDELGRASAVEGSSGEELAIRYDLNGAPTKFSSRGANVVIRRDEHDRIQAIESSNGYSQENTYSPGADGHLEKVVIGRGGKEASLGFSGGQLRSIEQFDGGQVQFRYYSSGDHEGLVEGIRTPNDLDLTYEYDKENRLVAVNCGTAYRLEYGYDGEGRPTSLSMMPYQERN